MFWNRRTDVLTREEFPEAVLFRIHVRGLTGAAPEATAIREALDHEAGVGTLPLIIDLSDVEYLDSMSLAWLVTLKNRLQKRSGPIASRRPRWELFAFFADETEALAAIRQGETDPLLFRGARRQVRDVFAVAGGNRIDQDSDASIQKH